MGRHQPWYLTADEMAAHLRLADRSATSEEAERLIAMAETLLLCAENARHTIIAHLAIARLSESESPRWERHCAAAYALVDGPQRGQIMAEIGHDLFQHGSYTGAARRLIAAAAIFAQSPDRSYRHL
jgi:hypothetical protein